MSTTSSAPPAPSAAVNSTDTDAWSPLAIIAIVSSIVLLLLCVPLIAICLRRYERKRCKEMVPGAPSYCGSPPGSSRSGGSDIEKLDEPSLRSILVTRELRRSSIRLAEPEQAHVEGRGWSDAGSGRRWI